MYSVTNWMKSIIRPGDVPMCNQLTYNTGMMMKEVNLCFEIRNPVIFSHTFCFTVRILEIV